MKYIEGDIMSKFWDRVEKCEHENLSPEYFIALGCGTPYCSGEEIHCLDCGVFIQECGCGYLTGMSGWSWKRYRKYLNKKGG